VVLNGERPGFENEWIVTAKTTADALEHRTVRAMTLVPLADFTTRPNIIVNLFDRGLSGKTLSTDFDVPDDSDIEFTIRVLLRFLQEFPRDFASN
jgi:hypothetical protein